MYKILDFMGFLCDIFCVVRRLLHFLCCVSFMAINVLLLGMRARVRQMEMRQAHMRDPTRK